MIPDFKVRLGDWIKFDEKYAYGINLDFDFVQFYLLHRS